MNQKSMIIGAVVILGLIGLVFYSTGFFASAENEFDLPGSDENLEVAARIDLTLNFADGESKTITGKSGSPLSVEYNGNEVSSVSWQMKAKAMTPSGSEPYDEVEINLNPTTAGFSVSDFALDSIVQYNTGDGQWRQHWTESTEATNQIISLIPDIGSYTVLYEHTVNFENVFDDSDSSDYSYKMVFDPTGYCVYRGAGGYAGGYGEWQQVSLGSQNMACEYPIDYINNQATVDWTSTVNWS